MGNEERIKKRFEVRGYRKEKNWGKGKKREKRDEGVKFGKRGAKKKRIKEH